MLCAGHRQLGAHEVGHTLGLAHNYMGSTYTGCPEYSTHSGTQGCDATVMDYPAPMIELGTAGELLETRAYAQHIGEWDKVVIEYGYERAPSRIEGDYEATKAWLVQKQADAERTRGFQFLEDEANGGRGGPDSSGGIKGMDWRSSQWDNGMSPADALEHALDVRAQALSTLDERVLQPFQPYSELRNVVPPVWLWHRYEVETAAKTLGGVEFQHIIKGDPFAEAGMPHPTAAAEQWACLDALLRCAVLQPDALNPSSCTPLVFKQPAAFVAHPNRKRSLHSGLVACQSAFERQHDTHPRTPLLHHAQGCATGDCDHVPSSVRLDSSSCLWLLWQLR